MFDAAAWIDKRFFSLEHAYDPIKAKAYYERTKELKGRKKGDGKPEPQADFGAESAPTPNAPKAPPASTESNGAALQAAATKRQAQLRARLERLEGILATLTEQAKKAAGVEPASSSETKKEPEKSDTSKEKEKPKTAAEKKEAAKKAAEDYEKNKDPETSASSQSLQDKIEAVQKQIADARESLRTAIERAKSMKPPKTPAPSTSQGNFVETKPPKKPTGQFVETKRTA